MSSKKQREESQDSDQLVDNRILKSFDESLKQLDEFESPRSYDKDELDPSTYEKWIERIKSARKDLLELEEKQSKRMLEKEAEQDMYIREDVFRDNTQILSKRIIEIVDELHELGGRICLIEAKLALFQVLNDKKQHDKW